MTDDKLVTPSIYSKLFNVITYIEYSIEKLMGVIAASSLISLSAIVMLQIFARLFLDTPPVWTEELSRYLFIATISSSIGIAFKRGELVSVDLIINSLRDIYKCYYSIATSLIILIFSLLIFPYAIEFAEIGKYQSSPTLFFSMSYVFSSTVILLANLIFFVTLSLIKNIIKLITWRYK